MYWKVSIGLKCVRISRIPCLLNLSPLKTVVSRKFTSLSEISAVNLIVGCCLFARTIKSSMFYVFSTGMVLCCLSSLFLSGPVSTADIKMLAEETTIFVPIAVPCIWPIVSPVKFK